MGNIAGLLLVDGKLQLGTHNHNTEEEAQKHLERHYEMNKQNYANRNLFGKPEIFVGNEAKNKMWEREYNKLSDDYKWLMGVIVGDEMIELDLYQRKPVQKIMDIVIYRLFKEGFGKTCTRCGGTGEYSFNRMDGTRCFKCHGNKFIVPKLTKKLKKQIAEHFNQMI